jgi:hypothetical protein
MNRLFSAFWQAKQQFHITLHLVRYVFADISCPFEKVIYGPSGVIPKKKESIIYSFNSANKHYLPSYRDVTA